MTTTAAPLRRPTPFVPFRTPVRGHVFAARPPGSGAPAPGQRVRLCREPRNPADPLAVAVWLECDAGPWRIGYLGREVAARIAPRLDAGTDLEARVDGWVPEPERRWQRPVLAVFPVPDRYRPPAVTPPASSERPAGTSPAGAGVDVLPGRPARSLRRRLPSGGATA